MSWCCRSVMPVLRTLGRDHGSIGLFLLQGTLGSLATIRSHILGVIGLPHLQRVSMGQNMSFQRRYGHIGWCLKLILHIGNAAQVARDSILEYLVTAFKDIADLLLVVEELFLLCVPGCSCSGSQMTRGEELIRLDPCSLMLRGEWYFLKLVPWLSSLGFSDCYAFNATI